MKTDTKFLRDFVRYNGLAWPGGYPMVLIMWDCNVIDAQSARENYRQILRAKQCTWAEIFRWSENAVMIKPVFIASYDWS